MLPKVTKVTKNMPKSPKKALKISAEICIHAVSCPGVVLINRGRLALSMCLLGFHTRTGRMNAKFPVDFNEKFKFDKTFVSVTNLSVLERVLESETVYLELIQEEASGESVLAVFESSVRDLLFPRHAERLSYSGNDLDLLMEPTRDFPGIISPKIEVSTQTAVGETRTPLNQCAQDNVSFGHCNTKTTKATYKPMGPKRNVSLDNDDTDAREQNNPSSLGTTSGTLKKGDQGSSDAATSGRAPISYKKISKEFTPHSQFPPYLARKHNYSGMKSRYLSRSAGNITDLMRESDLHNNRSDLRRKKNFDEDIRNAKVSLLEPERCPHCDGEHGAESCTTCRTYHRIFPRPSHQRPHIHAHSLHAHPHLSEAALKVLHQPSFDNKRRRKRYLVHIDPTFGHEVEDPLPRPSSAPPSKFTEDHSGISGDEDNEIPLPRRARERKKTSSRISMSRSTSRSPSPPQSHASAPPVLSRNYRLDSDDDHLEDYYYWRRKYRYPTDYSPLPYTQDIACPLCEYDSSCTKRCCAWTPRNSRLCSSRRLYSPLDYCHSRNNCSVCSKYGLYEPSFSRRYRTSNLLYPRRRYRYFDLLDSDDDVPISKTKFNAGSGSRVKFRNKNYAVESADEILSDVYNDE